ncbi:2-amino-4-hydroxy-6-hydroxymethyldihydropteridine pyrophosphokinase [Gracilibacillus halophilus YIM-C55.5]|uniref:2-amino-4-hydroxy-6-hydroxymethyldihydropteridine diphosphokinase n=1 Tax=Gracilibacillus halophilus YIM-C55.5 TaxID=1308866 RepID=N4WNE5_9BACI|nr:2-amino-4-hydroxy-6-hydroxymethyldihydropteridine diphosphokinase [Gracilibacillus halophilus]ENH97647.1 2-amino-4-hydroxy-6-hydroxymethyldihydropteridine pyrophosphokinase [Gracilibacillus halophilus YIM-C55.5]
MSIAYIALGSNIEPRYEYLQSAIKMLELSEGVASVRSSSIYQTDPVGVTEQEKFLNMVIEVETDQSATGLLMICQSIEKELGRKREIRWGPRTIDLDIILYNHENIDTEQLSVPHPRMKERAFVLIPLYELDRHLFLPTYQQSVASLLEELPVEEKRGVETWQLTNGENELKHFEN